jgi:hypothetical protein
MSTDEHRDPLQDNESGAGPAAAPASARSAAAAVAEAPGFSGDVHASTLGGAWSEYRDRLRGGDMGALPAVLGLVVLAIGFTVLRP